MSENEIRQRDYDNAYTDYTQSLHEENMRSASRSTWAIVFLTVIIALATIAQVAIQIALMRQSQTTTRPILETVPVVHAQTVEPAQTQTAPVPTANESHK